VRVTFQERRNSSNRFCCGFVCGKQDRPSDSEHGDFGVAAGKQHPPDLRNDLFVSQPPVLALRIASFD